MVCQGYRPPEGFEPSRAARAGAEGGGGAQGGRGVGDGARARGGADAACADRGDSRACLAAVGRAAVAAFDDEANAGDAPGRVHAPEPRAAAAAPTRSDSPPRRSTRPTPTCDSRTTRPPPRDADALTHDHHAFAAGASAQVAANLLGSWFGRIVRSEDVHTLRPPAIPRRTRVTRRACTESDAAWPAPAAVVMSDPKYVSTAGATPLPPVPKPRAHRATVKNSVHPDGSFEPQRGVELSRNTRGGTTGATRSSWQKRGTAGAR